MANLIGRKIIGIRLMTDKELEKEGWDDEVVP